MCTWTCMAIGCPFYHLGWYFQVCRASIAACRSSHGPGMTSIKVTLPVASTRASIITTPCTPWARARAGKAGGGEKISLGGLDLVAYYRSVCYRRTVALYRCKQINIIYGRGDS